MKSVEILSPAGNFESLYAAINNGADAVYLGLSSFNARGNIENFNLQNIEQAIKHTHLFGVKVYLTLNILFSDEQMEEVLQNVEKLLHFGVDAFIVQDLGLALAIKKTFPNAVLHASTQMGVCNLEGALVLKNLGFSRVVLARETRLEEIERIHKNCDIELEFFVQGALCVSYSGNCYLSALEAGASGNMGKCKQFCRLPYVLCDGKEKRTGFFLSAKDFCMLERLEGLANAGVCSFKIEGRARRAGYVAAATAEYRNAIDCLHLNENRVKLQDCLRENCKHNLSAKDEKKFNFLLAKNRLKQAFNRGNFTAGYFDDEKMIDAKIQGHRGVKVGRVLCVNFGKKFNVVKIESSHQVARGDGLKFLLNEKEIASVGVGDVKEISRNVFEITTTANVKVGSDVHLTLDVKNEEKLLEKRKKIEIYAIFCAISDNFAKLSLRNKKDNIEICVQSKAVCQPAQKQPLTAEEVKNQLCKGSEMFDLILQKVELENVFIRKSELNELRRGALEKMQEAMLENYAKNNFTSFQKEAVNFAIKNEKVLPQQLFLFSNLSQIESLIVTQKESAKLAFKLVYCPQNYARADIKKVCEKLKDFPLFLSLPIFANEKDVQLLRLILLENPSLGIFANNLYALNLDKTRKVIASQNLNVFNSLSVLALKQLGVSDIVVSIEQENALQNCGANLYCVQNYAPAVMNFVHCPFKEHFSSTCKNCKFHDGVVYQMQNGKTLSLVRRKVVTCNFALLSQNRISKLNINYGKATYLF